MNRSTSVELGAFECRRSPTRSAQLCALVLLVTAQVANAEVALPSTIGLAGRRLLAAGECPWWFCRHPKLLVGQAYSDKAKCQYSMQVLWQDLLS